MGNQDEIFHPFQSSTIKNYRNRDEQIRVEISKREAIQQIEQVYNAQYDPNCGLDGCFDVWNQLLVCEAIDEATPIKHTHPKEQKNNYEETNQGNTFQVKGKGLGYMVTTPQKYDYDEILNVFTTKKETTKENLALFLAQKLDDINSLNYYEIQVTKHRIDFLRNCLLVTLAAYTKGKVMKSKAAYFTGVLKNKVYLAERLKKYKQKHTT